MIIDNFRAGDTFQTCIHSQKYPPSAGWSGTLSLRLENAPTGSTAINVSATGTNSDYTVYAAPGTTSVWAAGRYRWFFQVGNGTDIYTLEDGWLDILASLSTEGTFDSRSVVKKTLDAINAFILAKATGGDIHDYTIAGRTLTKMPWVDVIKAQSRYMELYRRELVSDQIRQGKNGNTTVNVSFGGMHPGRVYGPGQIPEIFYPF